MLWVKAFHVISMVTWFAGLFYLPRLFVYHAMAGDTPSRERFKVMERKLFYGITTPGGIATVIFGTWHLIAWWPVYFQGGQGWMHAKLTLAALLIAYHLWCWRLVRDFAADRNRRSHVWFRWFNEFPVLILIGVVILVIVRPF
ncbi:MAG: protoporphyrinogen oxidase HemJ [Gammaproteobacteria bacterium]|nr:protoporphyrinogen oxidase HemJ [Gammaproteobacteria bacterium]